MKEQETRQLLNHLKNYADDYLAKALQNGKKETSGLYNDIKNLTNRNSEHIEIINREMGELRDEQKQIRQVVLDGQMKNASEHEQIQTDLSWLKKFQWLIVGTSVAALISSLIRGF